MRNITSADVRRAFALFANALDVPVYDPDGWYDIKCQDRHIHDYARAKRMGAWSLEYSIILPRLWWRVVALDPNGGEIFPLGDEMCLSHREMYERLHFAARAVAVALAQARDRFAERVMEGMK